MVSICSTTVASLPRSFLVSRTPKISLMRLAVKRHRPIFAASFEDFVDGKMALENEIPEIPAVLNLCDRVEPRGICRNALVSPVRPSSRIGRNPAMPRYRRRSLADP
jgi:hypothetical protein